MLESNTDRSYFMIGAVIVAAILIAGATYIFRDALFEPVDASGNGGIVPELVYSISEKANGMISGIDENDQTQP